jgi:hypothetical protein
MEEVSAIMSDFSATTPMALAFQSVGYSLGRREELPNKSKRWRLHGSPNNT